MMQKQLFAVVCVLLIAGCATGSASDNVPAKVSEQPAEVELAPTPFTGAQIRSATPEGRTYSFRIEALGRPTVHRSMQFTEVSDTQARLTSEVRDITTGATKVEASVMVTWDELVKHAHYPKAHTTIGSETLTVPAGTFDCLHYVVADPDKGTTTTAWFAKSLPGAPIKLEVTRDRATVMRMTLLRHVR